MNETFESYAEKLIDRHLPVSFLDYEVLLQFKKILFGRNWIGRKEVLIMAYLIGADVNESNKLLSLMGHPSLYCKKREDAIWMFALDQHRDSATVINEIFLQNVDDKNKENG